MKLGELNRDIIGYYKKKSSVTTTELKKCAE